MVHIQETMVRFHPGLLLFETTRPGTPTGRAVRLKPGCLRVRFLLWVLTQFNKWLGRQLADHLGLEPGMLWVRLPPGPLDNNTPSWSSLECSPPCQGGGRRFKSDRGCLYGAVRQLGRATDFKRLWMWVRLPPVLLEQQHVSAGHWRAQVAVTHPLSSFGGSTPSRRTYNTARSSNGRMRDPHSRDMGSIPIRVTQQHGQVAER